MYESFNAIEVIQNIQQQLASSRKFLGFRPFVIALTGFFALFTSCLQCFFPQLLASDTFSFLSVWIFLAIFSVSLIAVTTFFFSRQLHGNLADKMSINAFEQYMPTCFAGFGIFIVLCNFSPQTLWILPGVWQILIALGIFAALPTHSRRTAYVAAWYLMAGLTVLIISSKEPYINQIHLGTWLMGIPFGIGQLFMSLTLLTEQRS